MKTALIDSLLLSPERPEKKYVVEIEIKVIK